MLPRGNAFHRHVWQLTDMEIIDTDVHQAWNDPKELIKRLPAYFQQSHFTIPGNLFPSPVGVARQDSLPASGIPGGDYDFLCHQHIDRFGIDYAVLTGSGILVLGLHPNADYANALASAYNEAVAETWFNWDERFYGSLIINPSDPVAAAKEIRKHGSNPKIVEILMCSGTRIPLGQRFYWPIYEAAVEVGLPVAVHPGSEGRGVANGFIAGPPSTYLEWHTNLPQNYMGQIVSLVCEGIFEKFPTLKFVGKEGGLAWIPGVLWRLDKNWKALRSTVPWLKRLPSEYIVDHIRFTSQPIEEPPRPEQLLELFDMIHAEKTLMFSSDYPHWDNDSPLHAFPKLPEALQRRIFSETARETYPRIAQRTTKQS